MATVTKGGVLPDTGVTKDQVYALVDNATLSAIVNADIAANAAIADSKLATITTAGKVSGAAVTLLTSVPSGAGALPTANLPTDHWIAGSVVQVVNTQTGAKVYSVATTKMPESAIPTNTQGLECMTLAITPKSATNSLKIDVVANFCSEADDVVVALFVDTTANALSCSQGQMYSSANRRNGRTVTFTHFITTAGEGARTYKVRIGNSERDSMQLTFNGETDNVVGYGGVLASSITITEIKV